MSCLQYITAKSFSKPDVHLYKTRKMRNSDPLLFYLHVQGLRRRKWHCFQSFLCSETKQEPLRPFYLFTVWQLKIDEKNPGESGSPPLSVS